MKTKAFVVHNNPTLMSELNELLDKGWKVKEVHPSPAGSTAFWFVVAEEPGAPPPLAPHIHTREPSV